MDKFKMEAIIEEFPFMVEILRKSDTELYSSGEIDNIKIKRIDANLLNQTPTIESIGNSLFSREETYQYWIISVDTISKVIPNECVGSVGVAYTPDADWDMKGETIIEAIDRLGVDSDELFIVSECYEYDSTQSVNKYRSFTIFKPGKISISGEIAKARKNALAKVTSIRFE